MKIGNIMDLERLAYNDVEVYKLVTDISLGRRKVVDALDEKWDIQVSEKLIRTLREIIVGNTEMYEGLADTIRAESNFVTAVKSEPVTTLPVFSENQPVVIKQGKAKAAKTIVVMPDVQAPLHDKELVDKFVDFLEDYQPTELAQVGDFTDSTQISRWVRGKKEEYAGDLRTGFIESEDILADIRSVYDGRFRIVRSNHDDRLEAYIETCAPGLASYAGYELSFESLLHLEDYDVEFVRDGVIELVKDALVMGHGDEGSLSPQAGKTAFGLAKNKFGVSVVCGHTHRAGITSESYGYNGEIKRQLTGMEVGHFMDLRQAHYLAKSGGTANWQQAFGIVEVVHGKVFMRPVYVNNGEFVVDGKNY